MTAPILTALTPAAQRVFDAASADKSSGRIFTRYMDEVVTGDRFAAILVQLIHYLIAHGATYAILTEMFGSTGWLPENWDEWSEGYVQRATNYTKIPSYKWPALAESKANDNGEVKVIPLVDSVEFKKTLTTTRKRRKTEKLARAVLRHEKADKKKQEAQSAQKQAADHRVAAEAGVIDPMQFFEVGASGRLVFRPALLGKFLEAENPIRVGHDYKLWRFDATGVWLPDGEEWARQRMRKVLDKEYKRAPKDEVIDWLHGGEHLSADPSLVYINLTNGLLEWKTTTCIEHDPDLSSMTRIPVAWNPKATCPAFNQFLKDVLPPDAIEFMWEVIGYTLYPQNRFQRAILLTGPGGNGKGTLLDVITALLGDYNVSAKTLHQLSDDRFAAADLFGKLANICGDLDARTVERSDLFKMLTGRDLVDAQHKNKNPFKFRYYGKALFSANEIPPTADQSDGYFDRWLVVPMFNRIRGTDKEIHNIIDRLTTSAELEGVLVKAVAGLQSLMARGHFEVPASVQAAGDRMRAEQDTVRAFTESCCAIGSDTLEIVHADWYRGYMQWCRENGKKPLSMIRATRRLMESHPTITKEMNRARTAQLLIGICKGTEWPATEWAA